VIPIKRFLPCFLLVLASCSKPPPSAESREINPYAGEWAGATCDVSIDEQDLVHLRAGKEAMAYACLGWAHANFRAFQMDYLRRVASGRVAEVIGTSALKQDFFLRLVGLRDKALAHYKAMPEMDRKLLWAYSHGVNRAFATDDVKKAYEFRHWGYQPEPWHPVDSLAVLLLESFNETQASFWHGLKEEKARERFGPRAKDLFQPFDLPWDTPILKTGETLGDRTRHRSASRQPGFDTREGEAPWATDMPVAESGSNSWVIGKSRSKSGKSWLANDPHLELTHPSFWFWVHFQAGELNVIGSTVPGVPVVVAGYNKKVSWGLTDSYVSTGEILAIPKDDTHSFVSLRPTVYVKLLGMHVPISFKSFQRSPEGWPVLPLDAPKGKVLVLRWSGLSITSMGLSSLSRIHKSQSANETAQWFAGVELPSWNFVFTDVKGNLGYRAIGLLPAFDGERPFGVADGRASGLGEWKFLTAEDGPHVFNPKRDFVATANNRQELERNPQDRGRAHKFSFRAYRIEELIQKQPKHDFESMAQTQCDFQSTDAKFIVPRLMALADRIDRRNFGWGVRENQAIDAIRKWDYQAGPECNACAIYYRWTERINEVTGLDLVALYRWLAAPSELDFKLARALNTALDDLQVVSYRPFARWGDLHRLYFLHPTHLPDFETFDYLKTGGYDHTVNMGSGDWVGDHYRQKSGASHRLLVEMTDPPTGYFALPGTSMDTELKAIREDKGPWRQWQDCRYRKVQFPYDWDRVTPLVVTL